jgi:hypothetical protein
MATCPGALIVDADNTVMACTNDDDEDGCHGRDLRHEGDPVLDVDAVGLQLLRHPVDVPSRSMADGRAL